MPLKTTRPKLNEKVSAVLSGIVKAKGLKYNGSQRFGINAKQLGEFRNQSKPCLEDEVKTQTLHQGKAYWVSVAYYDLDLQILPKCLQYTLFMVAVERGNEAVKILQRLINATNKVNRRHQIDVNGIVGLDTLKYSFMYYQQNAKLFVDMYNLSVITILIQEYRENKISKAELKSRIKTINKDISAKMRFKIKTLTKFGV